MNHPDVGVAGKVFATAGYPDKTRGVVNLTPADGAHYGKDFTMAGKLDAPK